MLPSVKTLWHRKMQRALDELAAGVLNDTKVLYKTFRRLKVPLLLASLVKSDINILAIGRRQSWIINARTPDRRRFTGTKINYGYDPALCNRHNWQRLEEQVRRYASANAMTKVYILSPGNTSTEEVCYVSKSPRAPAQLPGCTQSYTNGVQLPANFQCPISTDALFRETLTGWKDVIKHMKQTEAGSRAGTR